MVIGIMPAGALSFSSSASLHVDFQRALRLIRSRPKPRTHYS
jgi:hypothetical protein